MAERNYSKGGRRNWRIRYVDETENWSADIVDALPAGSRIIAAYLYDPGVVTHCCSFQADQWNMGLCTFIYSPDWEAWRKWEEADEEAAEALRDSIELEYPGDYYFAACDDSETVNTGYRVTNADIDGKEATGEISSWEGSAGYISGEYYKLKNHPGWQAAA